MTKHPAFLIVSLIVSMLASVVGCSNTPSGDTKAGPEKTSEVFPAFAYIRDLAASATSKDSSSSLSFNVPIPGLSESEEDAHLRGDAEFSRQFSTELGVGPAFNANSCVACHARDGRGALPTIPIGASKVRLGANESLLLRVKLATPRGFEIVPGFTEQLFHRGVYSLRPDSPGTGQADVDMSFKYSSFQYPDGKIVELREPVFAISNAYDSLNGKPSALDSPNLRISPRIGPPMIGLGLLQAIDENDILANEDPKDLNADGISGRANRIDGQLGRFGWKANTPNIRHQVAAALSNDIGLRSSVFPLENISFTELFRALIERAGLDWKPLDIEFNDQSLNDLEFYTSTLAVPARRDISNPRVMRGAKTFEEISCTSCHRPMFKTSSTAKIEQFRNLEIYPFSDELLHDMGHELADHQRDHEANGREWKTRALWGLGLTQTVNPRAGFLHDGRARTVEEAILFHGGEASQSRARFAGLSADRREELLLFLRSL